MGCTPPIRTITLARRAVVFSTGATNPGTSEVFVFTPDELIQIAPMVAKVRATVQVENRTENFECYAVYQLTNDGDSWDTPQPIGLSVTTNTTYTSDWTAITNTKRGIRFGVVCEQVSGDEVESGRVSLILDIQLIA